MTLQSAIDAELPFLRAELEARMKDTCRITRPGDGPKTRDPETGKYLDPEPVIVYEGPCFIPRRGTTAASASAQAGEAAWQVGEYPLSIPINGAGYTDGEDVEIGNTVTYLTSVDDPRLAGRVFGITGVPRQSQATARRFRMKEAVGV